MKTKFNFKSAICTSRSQSERLLALGLKPETADMRYDCIGRMSDTEMIYREKPIIGPVISYYDIPAWSLDRLKELYKCVGDTSLWNLDDVNYDRLIQCIGLAIKHNSFNKEYLEE